MALCRIYLIQIGGITDRLNPRLRWDDFIITGHHGDSAKFEPFCQMHCTYSNTSFSTGHLVIQQLIRHLDLCDNIHSTLQFNCRTHKEADLFRQNAFFKLHTDPCPDRDLFFSFISKLPDFWLGSIEDRNRSTALFGVAVWIVIVGLLRMMAKADPLMRQVYIRHISYKHYYKATSSPWRRY